MFSAIFDLRRLAALAILGSLTGAAAVAQSTPVPTVELTPQKQAILATLPPYKPQYKVVGGLRIAGSELRGNVDLLVAGFKKFHPGAAIATNYMTSSEGALGMMYAGVSDVAPMGDDAKITDQMPFYNTFRYVPTEVSVATGGYDIRGTLFAWAIVVNAENPIAKLSMSQLDRIFGSERSGGWEIGDKADHNLLFTAKYARGADSNIRKWGQLGLTGPWAGATIQTYGYVAPGFVTNFERQVLHWSTKWNPNFKEYVEDKEATTDAYGHAVVTDSMLTALQKDKYGIAWTGLMHVNGTCVNPNGTKCRSYSGLKVLPISATPGGPAVPLTAENVVNRSYPLKRDAYIYVNKPPGRAMNPKVREFLRFVLSRDGQEIIAKAGSYSPLPASYLQAQLRKLDQ